jgi:hypothetical protein
MDTNPVSPAGVSESVSELWGLPYQPVGCLQCGQAFLAPPEWSGRLCPNCLNGALEPQPARLRHEPPELVLPFQHSPAGLLASLQRFTGGVWLAPDDFKPAILQQRLVPLYWPMWLVDGGVSGAWQAEVGFDYQVKSSQESYGSSGWNSHEVLETRVRWETRLGQLTRSYNNLAVPALSEQAQLVAMIGGSPIDQAAAYTPEAFQGAGMRIPDLAPEEAWPQAESAFVRAASGECQQAAGGQHLRGYSIQAQYARLNWTQLLAPYYLSYYTDDAGKHVPVYINGATGQVGGRRLASPRKGLRWAGVSLLLAVALFLMALALYALGRSAPQAAELSPVFWLLGFLAAGFAAIPAAWPHIWNRKN